MVFEGHVNEVQAVAFSKPHQLLVSGGMDDYALIWSVAEKRQIQKLRLRQLGRTDEGPSRLYMDSLVGIEVIDNEIILADSEGIFRVFDIRNFGLLQTFHLPNRVRPVPEEDGVEQRRGICPPLTSFCHNRGTLIASSGAYIYQFNKVGQVSHNVCDESPIVFAAVSQSCAQSMLSTLTEIGLCSCS
jgi:WD40 repeat protein